MLGRFGRTAAAVLSGVAAIFIAGASPAAAQDHQIVVRGVPDDAKMRQVTFGDLNLNIIAHRKILDDRVASAVRHVCDFGTRGSMSPDYRMCVDAAWAGAKAQITRAYVRAAQLAYGRR